MAGRRGLLADDGDHFLLLAVTPLRRARGPLACRTGAGGRRAGLALLSVSLLNALHEHDGSNLERVFILQQTWKMILQHPIVGWGYGGYAWSFAHFVADSVPPLSRRVPGLTYPHNDLLFWWVEGGAVALLGLLVLGVSGFWLLLRRPGVRQLALLACLMPILLHTQLEYPLYQSPVHWLLVLILVNLADRCPSGEQAPLPAFTAPSTRPVPAR
jgi:O-antigen polymerase